MSRTVIHVEKIDIDHSIEQVWALAAAFGAIVSWMPAIQWCTLQGDGVGSVRTVISFGSTVDEKLEVLDHENFTWSYRILDPHALPMKGGFGTWKLENIAENKTNVTWIADAEDVDSDGVEVIQPIFEPFMKDCLAGLKRALAKG
jgi:hypothetical protein